MSGAAAALAGRLRLSRRLLARPRPPVLTARLRRRLLMLAAVCLLLAAGYQFWLRDSSFVAVDDVEITGLSTEDAERVRMTLTAAGRSMTTLNVDREALQRAVAGYPVVRELEVATDFPRGLRIHVVEHVPAAIAVGDAGRVPVAGDGTILRGLPVEGRLPTVDAEGGFGTDRLRGHSALASAAVAGAAPSALRGRIDEVGESSERGLVAELREGPELIFGDATRLRAKWAAAARVLADLEASGASYVDVRIPGRPAAGGLPAETVAPVAPAGTASTVPPAGVADPAGALTPVEPAAPTSPAPTTTTAPAAPDPTAQAPAQTPPEAPLTGGEGGGATAVP